MNRQNLSEYMNLNTIKPHLAQGKTLLQLFTTLIV